MNTQLSHAEAQESPKEPQISFTTARYFPNPRKTMIILSLCMALQMTGFVMILPLFARRFSEFGAGVGSLGTSVMAGALAGTLAAPFVGALADRFGRRLLVLGSLAVYVLSFIGYLFASSALALILLRAAAGALTAGLVPAVISIAADLAPVDRRGRWIGIVSGGASAGWIAGPILGGIFYDRWGYEAAVIVSILMAAATFLTAFFTLPETHKNPDRLLIMDEGNGARQKLDAFHPGSLILDWHTFRTALPRSLSAFAALLGIYFTVMYAWAFIEPSFMFYAYDDLGWNSSMLGLVMSTYGIAMMLGEFGLGHLSDLFGRKPVIVLGVILFSTQFIGLAFFRNYIWISVCFVAAGLGNALFDPALSASILDITHKDHQARIQGLKSTAGSLGTILGPAFAILLTPFLKAQAIFLMAAGTVLLAIVIGLLVKPEPGTFMTAQGSTNTNSSVTNVK